MESPAPSHAAEAQAASFVLHPYVLCSLTLHTHTSCSVTGLRAEPVDPEESSKEALWAASVPGQCTLPEVEVTPSLCFLGHMPRWAGGLAQGHCELMA